MKNHIIRSAFCALFLLLSAGLSAQTNQNVAYQDATVRFTVITDGVIRMEWEPDGKFTDSPSFVASEREYPEVEFKVRKAGRNLKIETSKIVLSYKTGSGRFTKDNLSIKAKDGFFTWKPGMKQMENLKGTFRTLDGLDGDLQTQTWVSDMKKGEIRKFEDGILARDGWTLIDESENYLFDDSDWAWVKERETKDCQDWYFMAYGHDYKAALKDYTVFAGKMPLPPRFTFGYWWSRYWAYTDKEMRTLVDKFHAYDIPLDVLVVDMDWHYTDEGRGGWTGWTWNRSLFPDPARFMEYLKDEGLKVTLNLHPAEGFDHWEECYPALAESLGKDPASKDRIEWVNSDKEFMTNMFKQVMHPMQKEGVDFWWLDWQQHVFDTKLDKLHNTWWINYCYFSDMERNGDKRPLLYHRWGGLGNHRYQIGFSGDATITWKSLEFQPYFTSTASNVLYGYWSHDIGGHLGDSIDPEMYTRWLQYGGFSPVMRTHSSKSGALNKEPWVFTEEYTNVIRQTVRQRYDMAPYIYTMARKGYDEGIALCRPLYYDWPEAQEAYDVKYRSQYMFGDDMLIAPVTRPMTDGFAEMEIWLPEGTWYELHTGTMLEGGQIVTRHFALDEYGVYVKAGSVLPFYGEEVENLNSNDEDIYVTVFPGGEGCFKMYEDAGNDKDYAEAYATTSLSNRWNGNMQTVTISPRNGSYKGMPAEREFKVKVVASEAPSSVSVNGEDVPFEYLGEDLAFVIDVPVADCSAEKTIVITYADDQPGISDGLIGLSRRVARSIEALKFRTGADPIDDLAMMGTINEAIMYAPENAAELAEAFMNNYNRLPEILAQQPRIKETDIEWFLQHCGWSLK
ncbi:MAG: DUF5110 domain-containing protein [Bacteroidales bacterium]|nr:DUF5110 domain-containing protein [Bacteroidales bacterium]